MRKAFLMIFMVSLSACSFGQTMKAAIKQVRGLQDSLNNKISYTDTSGQIATHSWVSGQGFLNSVPNLSQVTAVGATTGGIQITDGSGYNWQMNQYGIFTGSTPDWAIAGPNIGIVSNGTYKANFSTASLTAQRNISFPDKSGTFAYIDDLHSPVSLGFANGLTLTTQTLSLGLASATDTGALSSVDWSIFNNKQSQLSGTGILSFSGTSPTFTPSASGQQLFRRNSTNTAYEFWTPDFVNYNLFTSDGSLAGNRSIYGAGHNLTIDSVDQFQLNSNAINIESTDGTTIYSGDILAMISENEMILRSVSNDNFSFINSSNYNADLITSELTASRSYIFPDTSGTIGLKEDDVQGGFYSSGTLTLTKSGGGAPISISGFNTATPNNGTLTMSTSGILSGSASFTANQSGNSTFTVTAPSYGTTAGTIAQGNDSRFHNAITLGTSNGLSLSTQVLSLGLATGSTNGALSSTDWNTFNNKQDSLTPGVDYVAPTYLVTDTFTPNCSGSDTYTPSVFHYTRVGDYIHVSGSIAVTSIGTLGNHTILIDLPVYSALSSVQDISGVISGNYNPAIGTGTPMNFIQGDLGTGNAEINFSTDATTATIYVQFDYVKL